jgi:hypothetical protein
MSVLLALKDITFRQFETGETVPLNSLLVVPCTVQRITLSFHPFSGVLMLCYRVLLPCFIFVGIPPVF